MSEENKRTIKPFYRIMAATLAVVFLFATFVGINTKIAINSKVGTDTENAAANYLIDNTEYINSNIFQRGATFLKISLMRMEIFEDLYSRASIAIAEERYADALQHVDRCIAAYYGNEETVTEDLWIKKACLEALEGSYEDALQSFGVLEDSAIYRRDIGEIIVHIYIEIARLNDADEYLEEYLLRHKNDYTMMGIYAEVNYLTYDYETAADTYTLLLNEQTMDKAARYFVRGMCYEQLDEYESAVADFQQALSLGYEDAGYGHNHIALCAYMLGRHDEVLEHGSIALASNSEQIDYGMLYNIQGLARFQMEDYELAVESLSSAIEIDEGIEDVYYYRGVCYMAMEEYQKGEDDFTVSIQKGQQTAVSYYNRGLCRLLLEEIDQAKQDFESVSIYTDDEKLIEMAQEFLNILGT